MDILDSYNWINLEFLKPKNTFSRIGDSDYYVEIEGSGISAYSRQ